MVTLETSVPTTVGRAFVETLSRRDFAALTTHLSPDIRMRTLLPTGFYEFRGARDVTAAFAGWFGDHESFAPVATDVAMVADRIRLRWRFQLRWNQEPPYDRLIEQVAFAKVVGDRIAVLDLVCAGFRPRTPSGVGAKA